jgi:hypothetical protein
VIIYVNCPRVPVCQSQLFLNSRHVSCPSIPSFPHVITRPPVLPQITILTAYTILSQASTPQGSAPNMAVTLIPILAPVIGLFAVFIVITLGYLCWVPRRSISTKASSADLKACPVPNEAGRPNVINAQPEPSNEGIMESPDEEALSLSTTTDSPTTPMRVYVRIFVPSFRSRLFILFLGS